MGGGGAGVTRSWPQAHLSSTAQGFEEPLYSLPHIRFTLYKGNDFYPQARDLPVHYPRVFILVLLPGDDGQNPA